MIKIQKKDFFIEKEIKKYLICDLNIGAVNNFIGYVKKNNNSKKVRSIYLEVYPKMAKKELLKIINQAKKKWKIKKCLIIHRYGKLNIGDKIVMVGVSSKNRKDSFLACKYIMDFLKKDAPFWKKEIYKSNYNWMKN
tara:strand:+ start:3216 stop:3626 length:411 start_codon:yes stop_codon:yes gene_type:complete